MAPAAVSSTLGGSPSPPHGQAVVQVLSKAEQEFVDSAVDLGGLDVGPQRRAQLVEQVRALAEVKGVMLVTNFGVEQELVQKLNAVTRYFFSLPMEAKVAGDKLRSSRPPGYANKFSTNLSEPYPAFREIYRVHGYPDHARAENVWPTAAVPSMQATFEEYLAGMRRAGEFVTGLLLEGLGLPPTYLVDRYRELGVEHKAIQTLTQNHIREELREKASAGLLTHTDPSLCNFNVVDGVRGLQFYVGGEWLTIPPVAHGAVLNIGDDLETISNGRYHSCTHRVLTASQPRISQLTSVGVPHEDAVIGPAAELIDDNHPALYTTRRAGDRLSLLTTAFMFSVNNDRTKQHMFLDFNSYCDKTRNMYLSSDGKNFLNGSPVQDWGLTMPEVLT